MQHWIDKKSKPKWTSIDIPTEKIDLWAVHPGWLFGTPREPIGQTLDHRSFLVINVDAVNHTTSVKQLELPLEQGQKLVKLQFNQETLILTCECVPALKKRFFLLETSEEEARLATLVNPDDVIRNPQQGPNWGSFDYDFRHPEYSSLVSNLRIAPNNRYFTQKDFFLGPARSSEDSFSKLSLYRGGQLAMEIPEPSHPGLVAFPVGFTYGVLRDTEGDSYFKSAVFFVKYERKVFLFY